MIDKLDKIFKMQEELRIAIGEGKDFLKELSPEEKGTWIRKYLDYIRQEVAEAYDCLAYKHWDKCGKETPNKILDEENLKIEIIDILFFLLDICHILDLDSEKIFKIYSMKQKINLIRQQNNYSVLTKTEEDNLNLREEIKKLI